MFHWVSRDPSFSGKAFRNLGYSVVTPADLNLLFDGTDPWTASLCHWNFHWICGRICHQPNSRTPYRWLSKRGPSETAPSACGTRWPTRRGEFTFPCASVGGRTSSRYTLRSEDLIFVLQDIWFGFKNTKVNGLYRHLLAEKPYNVLYNTRRWPSNCSALFTYNWTSQTMRFMKSSSVFLFSF